MRRSHPRPPRWRRSRPKWAWRLVVRAWRLMVRTRPPSRWSHWWPLRAVAVAGDSMTPTLHAGDLLLVARTHRVRPGDLVMVRRPDRPSLLLVKRATTRRTAGWWVEGDNPARSDDSRLFGPVPDDCLLGRAIWRYWPLGGFGRLPRAAG